MNSIGFSNFRQFDKLDPLRIKEISILVGKNNSGKSTVVKSILLINHFLKAKNVTKFSFSPKVIDDTNIINFGRAKNVARPKNDKIEFTYVKNQFKIDLTLFGKEDDVDVSVFNFSILDQKRLLHFNFDSIGKNLTISRKKVGDIRNKENISYFDKMVKSYTERLKEESLVMGSREHLEIIDQLNMYKEKRNAFIHSQVSETKIITLFKAPSKVYYEITDINHLIALEHMLEDELQSKKFNSDYLRGNYKVQREYALLKYKLKIVKSRKKILQTKIEWCASHYEVEYNFATQTDPLEIIYSFIENVKEEILKNSMDSQAVGENLRYLNQRNFYDDIFEIKQSLNTFRGYFFDADIQFVEAGNSKQPTLFNIRDNKNKLSRLFHRFCSEKIQIGDSAYRFIRHWLREFEIGNVLTIHQYAGEAYEVSLGVGKLNKKRFLSDMGSGSIQIMTLLLAIAIAIQQVRKNKEYVTLIFEEPEQNLHPRLQSKLPELFHKVYSDFGICFIVETHSEYFVRSTQVIVNKNEYEVLPNYNPFSVTYFSDELKQWEMTYNQDGRFNETFGEGFFDEAWKLTSQII